MDCQTAKKAKNATRPAAQRVKKNNDRKGVSLKELKRGGDSRSKCEEIYLPMCKGLVPYTQTKLPNQFNHTTQLEVYRHLERLWPYMDQSCSKNVRLLACSTYLPKCHGKQPAQGPCKKTCMQAKKKCADMLKELMGFNWADKFECKGLPARNCVKPVRDTKCLVEHTHCVENSVMPMCGNLTFPWGTLPNMFGQCSVDELKTEMQQFDALVSTNCHLHLKFLICGVYSPFCVRNEVPFTFPCREICEEIRQACEPHYRRLYHQLPWPQKLQCHRYPTSESKDIQCVMPNEGSTFYGG
ncbi:hypothetical protein BsWGS_28814 [Bradybaena similaris]